MPAISEGTAEVLLRELDMLINRSEGDEPDPLTEDVHRAREELKQVVEGRREVKINSYLRAVVTEESVTIEDEQHGEIALSGGAFESLIAEYVKAGGLDD